MENLTVHLKVVGKEIAGIQLLPNWHTVVLKQEKTGRKVAHEVQPGETLNRKWYKKFSGDSDYMSIPVTNDSHLRHEFHAAVDHVSPGRAFDAFYVLNFSVSDQRKVALQWAQDPVRKVEMEIRRVLNAITSKEDWNRLSEAIKRDSAVGLFEGDVRKATGDDSELRSFAAGCGIRIDRIQMTLRLSKKDAQPDEKNAELERSNRITEYDKQMKIAKTKAEHEVKVLETQNTAQLQKIEQWGKLNAGVPGHVDTALGQIAVNTKSAAEFKRNVEMIQGLAIATAASSEAGHPQQRDPFTGNQLPGSANLLLSAALESKLVKTVNEIATSVDSLNGDLSLKQELASKLLHLVAEAWMGRNSSSNVMEKYAEEAKRLISQFSLTAEQNGELGRLTNVRALQDRLK
jgi:hypothetical protein